MTVVTWLLEELKKVHHPTEAMIMYAKKLEKQQIIDAYASAVMKENNSDYIGMHEQSSGEIYFNETYGSKGSENKINLVEIPQEQLEKERNPNYNYFSIDEPTEISDEEIEKEAKTYINETTYFKEGFTFGAKWYREQLKTKQ